MTSKDNYPNPRAPVTFQLKAKSSKPLIPVPVSLFNHSSPPTPERSPPQQQSKSHLVKLKAEITPPRPSPGDKKQLQINRNREKDERSFGGLDLIISGYDDQPSPPPTSSRSNSLPLADSVVKLRRSRSRSSSQEMNLVRMKSEPSSPPKKNSGCGYLVGPMKGHGRQSEGTLRGRGGGTRFTYSGGVRGRGIKFYETFRNPKRSRSRSPFKSRDSSRSRSGFKRRFLRLRSRSRSPSPSRDPKRSSSNSRRASDSSASRSLKNEVGVDKKNVEARRSPSHSSSRSGSESRRSSHSRSSSSSNGRYSRSSSPPRRDSKRSSSNCSRRTGSRSASQNSSPTSPSRSLKKDVDINMKYCKASRSSNHSRSRSPSVKSRYSRSRSRGPYSRSSPSRSPSPAKDPKRSSSNYSSKTRNSSASKNSSVSPRSLKSDCEARRSPSHSPSRSSPNPNSSRSRSSRHSRSRSLPVDPKKSSTVHDGRTESNANTSPYHLPSLSSLKKEVEVGIDIGSFEGGGPENNASILNFFPSLLSMKTEVDAGIDHCEAHVSPSDCPSGSKSRNTACPSSGSEKPRTSSPSPLDPRLKSANYMRINAQFRTCRNANASSGSPMNMDVAPVNPSSLNVTDESNSILDRVLNVGTSSPSPTSMDVVPVNSIDLSLTSTSNFILCGLLNVDDITSASTTDKNLEIGKICREWAQGNIQLISLICNTDKMKLMKAQEEEMKAKEEEISQTRRKLEWVQGDCEKMKRELRTVKGSQLNREALELLKEVEEKFKTSEARNADLSKKLECFGESLLQLRGDADDRRRDLERARNEFVTFEMYADELELILKRKDAQFQEQASKLEELKEKTQKDMKLFKECKTQLEEFEGSSLFYENMALSKEAEIKSLKEDQEEKDKRIAELELKLKEMGSPERELVFLEQRHREELLLLRKEQVMELAAVKALVIELKDRLVNAKFREEKKAEFDKLVQEFQEFQRKLEEKSESEKIEEAEDPPAEK